MAGIFLPVSRPPGCGWLQMICTRTFVAVVTLVSSGEVTAHQGMCGEHVGPGRGYLSNSVETGRRESGAVLPDAFRELLVTRELEEISYRRVVDMAGLPAGGVMSRLSRANRRLEECTKGGNMESDRSVHG